jgi:hypothetical protein
MNWSELDIIERFLLIVGLVWSFIAAMLPSKYDRPEDGFLMKGALAFARTIGILVAVLTIIAIRRLIWK